MCIRKDKGNFNLTETQRGEGSVTFKQNAFPKNAKHNPENTTECCETLKNCVKEISESNFKDIICTVWVNHIRAKTKVLIVFPS
jgi:hypothetical protein